MELDKRDAFMQFLNESVEIANSWSPEKRIAIDKYIHNLTQEEAEANERELQKRASKKQMAVKYYKKKSPNYYFDSKKQCFRMKDRFILKRLQADYAAVKAEEFEDHFEYIAALEMIIQNRLKEAYLQAEGFDFEDFYTNKFPLPDNEKPVVKLDLKDMNLKQRILRVIRASGGCDSKYLERIFPDETHHDIIRAFWDLESQGLTELTSDYVMKARKLKKK